MDEPLHPQASRISLAAWLVVGAWCLLAVLVIWLILAYLPSLRGAWFLEGSVFMGILSIFITFAIIYAFLAFTFRCQSCGKRFFVESFGTKHRDARRIWGMDHWASAVIDVLRRGECTCMGCG
jgi:hypothetical protein